MHPTLKRLSVLNTPGEPVRSPPRGQLHAVTSVDAFDRLLTPKARRLAAIHWTPMHVCRRAAHLLAPRAGDRVLDIGSGVGKLCALGSLYSPGTFVGIEQRGALVDQARVVAQSLGSSAQFQHGD